MTLLTPKQSLERNRRLAEGGFGSNPTIWLNGMTCIICLRGWYPGYERSTSLTLPCTHCGFQQQESMSKREMDEQRRIMNHVRGLYDTSTPE